MIESYFTICGIVGVIFFIFVIGKSAFESEGKPKERKPTEEEMRAWRKKQADETRELVEKRIEEMKAKGIWK